MTTIRNTDTTTPAVHAHKRSTTVASKTNTAQTNPVDAVLPDWLADMQALANDRTHVYVKRVAPKVEGNRDEMAEKAVRAFLDTGNEMATLEEGDVIGWTSTRKSGDATAATIGEAFNSIRAFVRTSTLPVAVVKSGDSIILTNPLAGPDAAQVARDEVKRLVNLRNIALAQASNDDPDTGLGIVERKAAAARAAKYDGQIADMLARFQANA